MWATLRLTGLIALAAMCAAAPASAAPFSAPLPTGYQPSGQPPVTGLYAEVTGLSSIYDDTEIDEFTAKCQSEGKPVTWQDKDKRGQGAERTYRIRDAVAAIRDMVRLELDPATCTARFRLDRQVTVRKGAWKFDEVPGFQDPDFACDSRRIGRRCSEQVIAGITVTCLNRGDGFVGDVICVSRRHDLTRGLLAGYSSYIDDGSMPTGEWQLRVIEPEALIDPAVFAGAGAGAGE